MLGLCILMIGSHYKVYQSHSADIDIVLEVQGNVVYDSDGFTPLIKASNAGYVDQATALIQAGAPLNSLSRTPDMVTGQPVGNTALHLALFSSNYDQNYTIASRLIDAGANVRIPNVNGDTPIHFCAQIENLTKRSEVVGLLIRNGADLNVQNKKGQTMAHLVVYDLGREWIATLFRSFGSLMRLDIRDYQGFTPRDLADFLGNTDIVNTIDQGRAVIIGGDGNITARDQFTGMTGLMLALIRGDIKLAKFLVEKTTDVNARINDRLQNTGLHVLLLQQKPDGMKFLIDNRANVNLANTDGDRPLHYVLKIDAIGKKSDAEMIQMRNDAALSLIDHGAEINAVNIYGNTVLHLAVIANARDLIKFLIDRFGARLNPSIRNTAGKTALAMARELGFVEIVNMLQALDAAQSFVAPVKKSVGK